MKRACRLAAALPSTLSALLALALAGCSSTPVQYYTLSAPSQPSAQAPAAAAGGAAPASLLIEVLPVGVPEVLDRAQMVVRQGDAAVTVVDGHRWASPLGDELRTALSAELVAQWGATDAAGLPRQPGAPLWRIKLEVRRIDAWPGRQLQWDTDWSAGLATDAARRMTCSSRIAVAAPADPPGLAAAHQAAVRQLAQHIGRALQAGTC